MSKDYQAEIDRLKQEVEYRRDERASDEARIHDLLNECDNLLEALRVARRYVEYATRGPIETECRKALEVIARIDQLLGEKADG